MLLLLNYSVVPAHEAEGDMCHGLKDHRRPDLDCLRKAERRKLLIQVYIIYMDGGHAKGGRGWPAFKGGIPRPLNETPYVYVRTKYHNSFPAKTHLLQSQRFHILPPDPN